MKRKDLQETNVSNVKKREKRVQRKKSLHDLLKPWREGSFLIGNCNRTTYLVQFKFHDQEEVRS